MQVDSIHITAGLVGATAAVVVPVTAVAVAYMRLSMSNALRGLKLDLIKELNGTYIRRVECALQHSGIKERVEDLERASRNRPAPPPVRGERHGTIYDTEKET